MQALEQTMQLNSIILEQEPISGFGFNPWLSTPDSNDTRHDHRIEHENSTLNPEESRRLRRMKSNRESARRSRMRKQIHLEEVTIEFDRLQGENHDLRTRLTSISNRTSLIRHENRRLQIKAALFKKRLDEAQTLLSIIRHLQSVNMPQNYDAFGHVQASSLASLIA